MVESKQSKKQKLEHQILNQLNIIIRQQLNDERLKMASITKVELNRDNSQAKVYWDTFQDGKRGDIKKGLENALKSIRGQLAKSLRIRHVPELSLFYDSQFVEENKITELLNEEMRSGEESEEE